MVLPTAQRRQNSSSRGGPRSPARCYRARTERSRSTHTAPRRRAGAGIQHRHGGCWRRLGPASRSGRGDGRGRGWAGALSRPLGTQVGEDPTNDAGIFYGSDQAKAAPTPGTGQDVDLEGSPFILHLLQAASTPPTSSRVGGAVGLRVQGAGLRRHRQPVGRRHLSRHAHRRRPAGATARAGPIVRGK
jgi:hypothetical protein